MNSKIELLDCTLRDGAYIVDAKFGTPAIKGIIKKMQNANVDIIECGWLKNASHEKGTSFFHSPSDLEEYLVKRSDRVTYVAMIDWDRYDLDYLPECDGKTLDAIRIVFPYGKYKEGIAVGKEIAKKGYKVFFQAANTLAYSNEDLVELAREINEVFPMALSIVDTFGAMYEDDLERIVEVLNHNLRPEIKLGFHSHNNQQLSFALSMRFVELLEKTNRKCIVDASLCGMGRGAGNATTELVANYLNRKQHCNYDMNQIMDAIDMYMSYFKEHYTWGYSTPYFIAGMYCCHVNNIAYLQENHRTNAQDMRNIIESLSSDDRKKYDYDLLEKKYMENQNRIVNDEKVLEQLENDLKGREILLIAPGKSSKVEKDKVKKYIEVYKPIVIGVNAILENYQYNYLFFSNRMRYEYAKEVYTTEFYKYAKILVSNIKTIAKEHEIIVNYNYLIKREWEHSDNAVIMCLRLLNKIHVRKVALVGFDGFRDSYLESYADASLPHINPGKKWEELNREIKNMFVDFQNVTAEDMDIEFVTPSVYEVR